MNALTKQTLVMRRAMCKPREIHRKKVAARLTELINKLLILPGSCFSKKMIPEEINEILLHSVPNAWAKQAYLQGWDFDRRTYKDTCDIFEHMEIV